MTSGEWEKGRDMKIMHAGIEIQGMSDVQYRRRAKSQRHFHAANTGSSVDLVGKRHQITKKV